MTISHWRVSGVLTFLAAALAFMLGLDINHAAALISGAFIAGIANGLLESLTLHRFPKAGQPIRNNGLWDVQALEFSISSSREAVGVRADFQLRRLVNSVLAARGIEPKKAGGAMGAMLRGNSGATVGTELFVAVLEELSAMLRSDGKDFSGSPSPHPTKDHP